MNEKDGWTTAEQRLREAGLQPCPSCIWFKGEVSVRCAAHQEQRDLILKRRAENGEQCRERCLYAIDFGHEDMQCTTDCIYRRRRAEEET